MSTNSALVFDAVTKEYRGAQTYRALRDDIAGVATRWRPRRRQESLKALDDLSFEVPVGQSFGLIGSNGAGKSTALKIASRVTYPTRGRVLIRGRVGGLIEVGTGMHPELTGRENVTLYGRILGFSREDVRRRFDPIVEFAGLAEAIDKPVKRYSSGMQLRLGFAVAAHLDPDILLIDEALSVGDAGFQYRCVERMKELVGEGRTLIFVSHDMNAVESLCQRAILMDHGRIAYEGTGRDTVHNYLRGVGKELAARVGPERIIGERIEITAVTLHDRNGAEIREATSGEPLTVRLAFQTRGPVVRPVFSLGLVDPGLGLFALATMLIDGDIPDMLDGSGELDCTFTDLPLRPRTYDIFGSIRGDAGYGDLIDWQRLCRFRVGGNMSQVAQGGVAQSMTFAPVILPYRWDATRAVPGRVISPVAS